MSVKPLNFGRDVQGFNAYAPQDASIKYSATITNGNATSITVPTSYGVWIAAFSTQPGGNLWVDVTGATAAIPAGATLAASTSMLNPGQRTVFSGNTISIITDDTSIDVGIELWPVSYNHGA